MVGIHTEALSHSLSLRELCLIKADLTGFLRHVGILPKKWVASQGDHGYGFQ